MSVNLCLPFVMEFIFYFTQKFCMKSLLLVFKSPKMRYGMLEGSTKDYSDSLDTQLNQDNILMSQGSMRN